MIERNDLSYTADDEGARIVEPQFPQRIPMLSFPAPKKAERVHRTGEGKGKFTGIYTGGKEKKRKP